MILSLFRALEPLQLVQPWLYGFLSLQFSALIVYPTHLIVSHLALEGERLSLDPAAACSLSGHSSCLILLFVFCVCFLSVYIQVYIYI